MFSVTTTSTSDRSHTFVKDVTSNFVLSTASIFCFAEEKNADFPLLKEELAALGGASLEVLQSERDAAVADEGVKKEVYETARGAFYQV